MNTPAQQHYSILDRARDVRLKHSGVDFTDMIVSDIFITAQHIAARTATAPAHNANKWQMRLDNLLTSKLYGYPIMIMLLCGIFWLTIEGANIPSALLADALFSLQDRLSAYFIVAGAPGWLHGIIVLGMYRSLAWVVSVMLPPMAIFFPLFTILEDLGYLPRVAFNMDSAFKRCHACGKQILTICMGFGCNAAGIVACRIIDSPRERLIAILTNNFAPCNGRFPTLIAISTIFISSMFAAELSTFITAISVTVIVLLGLGLTFLTSWLLSLTVLKGEASSNILELPPYRMPQIGAVIYRSVIDRTLFVLARAALMAAPAGALIWLMANTYIGSMSALDHCTAFLDPFAYYLGIDGTILLAFILGLPANEIVVPIILMGYLSMGQLTEVTSLEQMRQILLANNWTLLTAVNTMLLCLLHFPCSTTLLTIYKETGSSRWTAAAFLLPTVAGLLLCLLTAAAARLFN